LLIYSREAIGFTDLTEEEIAAAFPAGVAASRAHPPFERTQIAVPRLACRCPPRLDDPGSAHVPADLTEHATQREFVYSHAWHPHDLVMWDNRATMHRAHRFDRHEVLDAGRTTLAGDGPTVEQAA